MQALSRLYIYVLFKIVESGASYGCSILDFLFAFISEKISYLSAIGILNDFIKLSIQTLYSSLSIASFASLSFNSVHRDMREVT